MGDNPPQEVTHELVVKNTESKFKLGKQANGPVPSAPPTAPAAAAAADGAGAAAAAAAAAATATGMNPAGEVPESSVNGQTSSVNPPPSAALRNRQIRPKKGERLSHTNSPTHCFETLNVLKN